MIFAGIPVIRKVIFAAAVLLMAGLAPAFAQTSPNFTYGYVPTVAQWNALFAGKQDVLAAPPLLTTGGTMLGPLITSASTSIRAGLNVPPGAAPSSPNNGDFWSTPAGFFGQVNGATVGPFTAATGGSFAATSPLSVSFPSGIVTYAIGSTVGVPLGGSGATSFTAGLPLLGNGTSAFGQGTLSGNTTKLVTTTGTLTPNNCVNIDASGNFVPSGATCGAGNQQSFAQDFLSTGIGGTGCVAFTAGTTTTLTLTNACFTGSISGTTLTVTAYSYGSSLSAGHALGGAGITAGTTIVSGPTTCGGNTCYVVSASQTVGSESMTTVLAPTAAALVNVLFDGTAQSFNTFSVSGATVTLSAAIPTRTQVVDVRWYASTTLAGVASFNGRFGTVIAQLGDYASSIVGNVMTYTGAVSRTVLAKLMDWPPSVKDFGAAGNGVTNDTTAFQLCANTGRLCYIPKGDYISAAITQSAGGFYGDGTGLSRIFSTETSADHLTFTGCGSTTSVPTFKDFSIQPNTTNPTGSAVTLNCSGGNIGGAQFFNFESIGMGICMHSVTGANWNFTNSRCLNYAIAGLWVQDTFVIDSGDSFVTGNLFNTGLGTGDAILHNSGGGLYANGNKILGGTNGYHLSVSYTGPTGDSIFVNNQVESVTSSGAAYERTSGTGTFSKVVNSNNQYAQLPVPISVDNSGFISLFAFNGNIAQSTGALGFFLQNVQFGTVSGNTMFGRNSGDVPIFTGSSSANVKVGGNGIYNFANPNSLSGTNISTTY